MFNNATLSTDLAALQYEMYDLTSDPNEAHNLYNNADYAELKKNLTEALSAQQTLYNDTKFVLDDETPPDVQP